MNTPAHLVLNLLAIRHGPLRSQWVAVTAGALLPDLPMFGFYLVERLRGTPERTIWSESYFEPAWQLFFDLFNSIPVAAIGLLAARALGSPWLLAFFLSLGLHCVADLLLHHDDAHRHFLPLSDWRFASPVSYWDPRHYGRFSLAAEMVLMLGGCLALLRAAEPRPVRVAGGVILALYVGFAVYAVLVWGPL